MGIFKLLSRVVNDLKRRSLMTTVLAFSALIGIIVAFSVENAVNLETFNADNFRYALSALMQIVGAIFAFILTGLLITMQVLKNDSPNYLEFFPNGIFLLYCLVSIINLATDTILLLTIEDVVNAQRYAVYQIGAYMNFISILLAVQATYFIIRFLTPRYQVYFFIRQAKAADNNVLRLKTLYAVEEMLCLSIKKGQSGLVREYQKAFDIILSVFAKQNPSLNCKSNLEPEHPLRIIPGYVDRVISLMVSNDMPDLLHFFGHTLRKLSGANFQGRRIASVEIALVIRNITQKCVEHKRIQDLVNFYSNFIFCYMKEDDIDTILWGASEAVDYLIHIEDIAISSELIYKILSESVYALNKSVEVKKYRVTNLINQIENLSGILDNQFGHDVRKQLELLRKQEERCDTSRNAH